MNCKVILIIGPSSSGKSTFVNEYFKQTTQVELIPRKEIFSTIQDIVTNQFMLQLLKQIQIICGLKITNIHELNLVKTNDMPDSKRDIFLSIKKKIHAISKSKELDIFIKHKVFQRYAEYAEQCLNRGKDIIIDESLIKSNQDIDIFKQYFDHRFTVINVLLYSSLYQLFQKYLIRNNKFFYNNAHGVSDPNPFNSMLKMERCKGHSSFSFRNLNDIFYEYCKFYHILPKPLSVNDNYIEKLDYEDIRKLIGYVEIAYKKSKEKLECLDYFPDEKSSPFYIPEALLKIVNEKVSGYVLSKVNYDCLLRIDERGDTIELENFAKVEKNKVTRDQTKLIKQLQKCLQCFKK
jgi:predicted kinase